MKPMLRFESLTRGRGMPALATLLLMGIHPLLAETLSPLTARGYTVLPIPQTVALGPRDFALTDGWQVVLERGVKEDDVAVQSLRELLSERFGLRLAEAGADRGVIRLAVAPNSVAIGAAADKDKDAIAEQAYRLTL